MCIRRSSPPRHGIDGQVDHQVALSRRDRHRRSPGSPQRCVHPAAPAATPALAAIAGSPRHWADWAPGSQELRLPAPGWLPGLSSDDGGRLLPWLRSVQRPTPGRPNPAPGISPAPEAGPPAPPAAGAGPAGLTRPGPAWPNPTPGVTPAPEAGPPAPPAAGCAGFTRPGPAWPNPTPGVTPAPEAGPPAPPRTALTWAWAIPFTCRQAQAVARIRA
jgi:hypothetical protein